MQQTDSSRVSKFRVREAFLEDDEAKDTEPTGNGESFVELYPAESTNGGPTEDFSDCVSPRKQLLAAHERGEEEEHENSTEIHSTQMEESFLKPQHDLYLRGPENARWHAFLEQQYALSTRVDGNELDDEMNRRKRLHRMRPTILTPSFPFLALMQTRGFKVLLFGIVVYFLYAFMHIVLRDVVGHEESHHVHGVAFRLTPLRTRVLHAVTNLSNVVGLSMLKHGCRMPTNSTSSAEHVTLRLAKAVSVNGFRYTTSGDPRADVTRWRVERQLDHDSGFENVAVDIGVHYEKITAEPPLRRGAEVIVRFEESVVSTATNLVGNAVGFLGPGVTLVCVVRQRVLQARQAMIATAAAAGIASFLAAMFILASTDEDRSYEDAMAWISFTVAIGLVLPCVWVQRYERHFPVVLVIAGIVGFVLRIIEKKVICDSCSLKELGTSVVIYLFGTVMVFGLGMRLRTKWQLEAFHNRIAQDREVFDRAWKWEVDRHGEDAMKQLLGVYWKLFSADSRPLQRYTPMPSTDTAADPNKSRLGFDAFFSSLRPAARLQADSSVDQAGSTRSSPIQLKPLSPSEPRGSMFRSFGHARQSRRVSDGSALWDAAGEGMAARKSMAMGRRSTGPALGAPQHIRSLDQLYAQAEGCVVLLRAKVKELAGASQGKLPVTRRPAHRATDDVSALSAETRFVRWAEAEKDDVLQRRILWTPLKSKKQAMEKVLYRYQGNVSRILDVSRETIVFETPQDLAACVHALCTDQDIAVERIRNLMDSRNQSESAATLCGFRAVVINLRFISPLANQLGIEFHVSELVLLLESIALCISDEGHADFLRLKSVLDCEQSLWSRMNSKRAAGLGSMTLIRGMSRAKASIQSQEGSFKMNLSAAKVFPVQSAVLPSDLDSEELGRLSPKYASSPRRSAGPASNTPSERLTSPLDHNHLPLTNSHASNGTDQLGSMSSMTDSNRPGQRLPESGLGDEVGARSSVGGVKAGKRHSTGTDVMSAISEPLGSGVSEAWAAPPLEGRASVSAPRSSASRATIAVSPVSEQYNALMARKAACRGGEEAEDKGLLIDVTESNLLLPAKVVLHEYKKRTQTQAGTMDEQRRQIKAGMAKTRLVSVFHTSFPIAAAMSKSSFPFLMAALAIVSLYSLHSNVRDVFADVLRTSDIIPPLSFDGSDVRMRISETRGGQREAMIGEMGLLGGGGCTIPLLNVTKFTYDGDGATEFRGRIARQIQHEDDAVSGLYFETSDSDPDMDPTAFVVQALIVSSDGNAEWTTVAASRRYTHRDLSIDWKASPRSITTRRSERVQMFVTIPWYAAMSVLGRVIVSLVFISMLLVFAVWKKYQLGRLVVAWAFVTSGVLWVVEWIARMVDGDVRGFWVRILLCVYLLPAGIFLHRIEKHFVELMATWGFVGVFCTLIEDVVISNQPRRFGQAPPVTYLMMLTIGVGMVVWREHCRALSLRSLKPDMDQYAKVWEALRSNPEEVEGLERIASVLQEEDAQHRVNHQTYSPLDPNDPPAILRGAFIDASPVATRKWEVLGRIGRSFKQPAAITFPTRPGSGEEPMSGQHTARSRHGPSVGQPGRGGRFVQKGAGRTLARAVTGLQRSLSMAGSPHGDALAQLPKVKTLELLYRQAAGVYPLAKDIVQAWAMDSGGLFQVCGSAEHGKLEVARWDRVVAEPWLEESIKWPSLKNASRAIEKLTRSYGGSVNRLLDICRFAIIYEHSWELADGVDAILRDPQVRITGVKNRFNDDYDVRKSAGYRDVHMNLVLTTDRASQLGIGSHQWELQLLLRPLAELRSDGGHHRYVEARNERAE